MLVKLKDQPPDSICLWKYMDVQKFLSFIIHKQFFYSRLDQLEDTKEAINQRYLANLLFHTSNSNDPIIDTSHRNYERFFFKKPLAEQEEEFIEKQKLMFVSCWITGNRESAGMWNLYSTPGGVAIKINYKSLIESIESNSSHFNNINGVEEVCYGMVEYSDFLSLSTVYSKSFQVKKTAFRKDLSFEHEREFRICIKLKKSLPETQLGISQKVDDMQQVPFEVIVHPKSTSWQYNNIVKLVETFLPKFKVRNSELKLRGAI